MYNGQMPSWNAILDASVLNWRAHQSETREACTNLGGSGILDHTQFPYFFNSGEKPDYIYIMKRYSLGILSICKKPSHTQIKLCSYLLI